jgi:hypothetical protein
MDEFAQAAVITAIGDSAFEGPLDAATDGATQHPIVIAEGERREYTFAADVADLAGLGINCSQARRTNGETRDIQQRFDADAAIGRKENGKNAGCGST